MLEALQKIWEFLFGCRHGRLSRPFTISGDTYKVCLSCGRKLTYSLDTRSIIRRKDAANSGDRYRSEIFLSTIDGVTLLGQVTVQRRSVFRGAATHTFISRKV